MRYQIHHPTPKVLELHQRDYQADGYHNKNPLLPSGVTADLRTVLFYGFFTIKKIHRPTAVKDLTLV